MSNKGAIQTGLSSPWVWIVMIVGATITGLAQINAGRPVVIEEVVRVDTFLVSYEGLKIPKAKCKVIARVNYTGVDEYGRWYGDIGGVTYSSPNRDKIQQAAQMTREIRPGMILCIMSDDDLLDVSEYEIVEN